MIDPDMFADDPSTPDPVDSFTDEPRKPASHRSDLVPIGESRKGRMFWHDMADRAVARMTRIRREDCPSCTTNSAIHRSCTSRNDPSIDHGLDQQPMCKHAASALVDLRVKQRVQQRGDRLAKARVPDPEVRRVAQDSRVPPLAPESWFADPFDVSRTDRARATMVRFLARADPAHRCLFLMGGVGAGKSTLAAWALAETESGGFWLAARDVIDTMIWKDARHRALHAELLVLDDLGREEPGREGWVTRELQSLLCDRLDGEHLTIVTMNLDGNAFAARYGEGDPQIAARLRSRVNAHTEWTDVGNADLRAASKRVREQT